MKTARVIIIILVLLTVGLVIFGFITKKGPFSKKQIAPQATPNPYDLGLKKVSVDRDLAISDQKEVFEADITFLEPEILASKLKLMGNPNKTNANLWKWDENKLTLVYNFPAKSFDFKDENSQANRDLKDSQEAEKIAQDFIKTTKLFGDDFSYKVKETILLKGQEESGQAKSFKDANYLIVGFEIQFQGQPVFLESNRQAFMAVWVTKKTSVLRLTGSLPLQVSNKAKASIKSEQEVLKQISNHEGAVISITQTEAPDKGEIEDFSYQQAKFSKAFLGYNTLGNKLLPIYVFVGSAKNRVGKGLEVTAFVHALKKLP